MYKEDLALNNLQWLVCHKTKPNQTKPNQITYYIYIYIERYIEREREDLALKNQ